MNPSPMQSYNVLFLCTGNSARSIMAEAILNKLGAGRFHAYSAGSQPKGQVNPYTVALLRGLDYDTSDFHSKSWSEFAKPGSPALDFVFTVCDNAAGETCPVWPGQPMTAHWGVPDPAEAQGTPAEIALAFKDAYRMLHQRIRTSDGAALTRTGIQLATTEPGDADWLRGVPERLRTGAPPPPVGRFNAGQKLNARLSALGLAVLYATGLALLLAGRGLPQGPLHTLTTVAVCGLLSGHVFMAVLNPATRHALRGMTFGDVDRNWAKHHHPLWVAAVDREATVRRSDLEVDDGP